MTQYENPDQEYLDQLGKIYNYNRNGYSDKDYLNNIKDNIIYSNVTPSFYDENDKKLIYKEYLNSIKFVGETEENYYSRKLLKNLALRNQDMLSWLKNPYDTDIVNEGVING